MQSASAVSDSKFIASLAPLPESARVDFLVSLFEARREILLALDLAILPSNRSGLDTEDFEFLLAVDALSRETVGGVTVSRLQQELGVSVATVHRRIRSLSFNSKWLDDPKRAACIQFSESGLNLWNRLMIDLSAVSESWLSNQYSIGKDNQILNHKKVLSWLRCMFQSQHLSRNTQSLESFNKYDLKDFQDVAFNNLSVEVVVALLRIGRQLSQPCEDLAIRHQLSLNEADILVVLALNLSENIKNLSDPKYSYQSEDKIGWDSFNQINRYLVHSHRINTSVFSRCIKHLGDGDGNLGLIQVRSWGGRSKAARINEQGYRYAERLWRDYLTMADGLLQIVPDDLIKIGVSIHKQISYSAERFLLNNNKRDEIDEKYWSSQSVDRKHSIQNDGDPEEGSDSLVDAKSSANLKKQTFRNLDKCFSDSNAICSVLPKSSAEDAGQSMLHGLHSSMGGLRSSGTSKQSAFGRQFYIQKQLIQENQDLRNTIDGLLAIINRFRHENNSLERQFYEIELKHRNDKTPSNDSPAAQSRAGGASE